MQHTVRLHCIILLLAHNTSCFIIIKENKYILTLFFFLYRTVDIRDLSTPKNSI